MTTARNCATGKRPLSHYHANKNPGTCYKCQECGYMHRLPETEQELPSDYRRARDIRPIDRVEVEPNTFETVVGQQMTGDVVELTFSERPPVYVAANTPMRLDTLVSRQRDAALADAVASTARESRQAAAAGDDFGIMAFDWMEAAIRLLKGGEWAEQHPNNAMLADIEVQIGELVARANRYAEIQNKYAAAVSTLGSLGYSYLADDAPVWELPNGESPNYIKWENGEIDGTPPVNAKFIALGVHTDSIIYGKVLGAGSTYILAACNSDSEENERSLEIKDFNFVPFNQEQVERAKDMAQIMNGGKPRYNNQQLKFSLLVIQNIDKKQGK